MDTNGIDRDWRSGVRRKPVSGKRPVIYVFPRYLYCRAFSGGCIWRGIDSGRAEASKTVLSSAYFTDESIVQ